MVAAIMPTSQPYEAILGSSLAIAQLREQVRHLATFDTVGNPHVPTVLVQGETGTGKGLVARALHDSGPRAQNPFIDVNCAAIPDTMLEAELFGFEAGAFTDARRAKPGLFEAASSGTLFLDEVDSLSLGLQAKLLKAIEEKSVRRLGALAPRRVDVKLIAATQHELEALVADGRFRADLYHRLAVLVLRIPPLRERRDDVELLAEHFLSAFARAHALEPRRLGGDARRWLRAYAWPGNVRELSHLAERATLLGPEGELDGATLEALRAPGSPTLPRSAPAAGARRAATALPEATDAPPSAGEEQRIRDALRRSGGNVVAAARMLGIGRNALRYRMRRLGIDKPSLDELATAEPAPGAAAPHMPLAGGEAARAAARATDPSDWEQKRVVTLVVDVLFPEPGDTGPRYEPWTVAARWKQALTEKLRAFGALLLDEATSRLSAAFGIPRALEQTPERAVRAALVLQQLGATAAVPRPELRIALHQGDVLFDAAADEPRALALGDTVALAERLLGHAGAGEILASPRVARQIAPVAVLEERTVRLGPRPGDEIVASVVTGARVRAQSARAAAEDDGTFVGRERELATLEQAFDAADGGHGQMVFLAGEAGIGKSRLLLELRRRLADRPHLWIEGRCASYGARTPFLPLIDALRRFLGIDDRDDDASLARKIESGIAPFGDDLAWTVPFLHQVLSVPYEGGAVASSAISTLDSASRRSETFRALRALLARAAERICVVLVVEDLHWIDRTSEEYLAFVAEVLPTMRVLLVCSHRPGYAHPFGDQSFHVRVMLRPLSDVEMAEMTRALLGTAEMPPAVRGLIARKAEGNPFFVEEVTRSLVEDGSLRCTEGRVELTRELAELVVPDTIQEVLTARIDRLADEARRAIQVASVIGREFALRLLERITEAGERVRVQLDELRSVELIYEKALHPELAYMFKHALTHDVAYQSVVAERRRALHRTIGTAIEELYADRLEEHYETLAHHFERGCDWARALHYHERASAKAAERHATQAVVEHCRAALAIAARENEAASRATLCRLESRLALACFYLSDFAAAADAYDRAAAASDDRATAHLLHAEAAHCRFWAHDYGPSSAAVEAILASAEAAPAARAVALNVRGFTRSVLDADFAGAERDYAAALHLAEARLLDVEASVRFNGTLLAEWTGDFRRTIEQAERVMAAGKELRLAHLVVWPSWFIGKALCCLGDYGRAIARLEEGYQVCDRIGDRAWKSRLLNTLGWCFAEIGCLTRAEEYNQRAAEVAHQLGDPEIVANSDINLALNRLARRRIDEACALLEPIENALSRPGDPWMRWRYALHTLDARARIDLATGAAERALELAERQRIGAAKHRAPKLEARALTLAGGVLLLLERWDEARERLEEALRVAERIAAPRAAWQAHATLARLYERRGRRDEAERHAAAHARLVDGMAGSLPAGDLRRAFLAAAAEPEALRAARP